MKKWFKFYGQEFLSDPKMLGLNPVQKALWLTLLCLASSSDDEGIIRYVEEWKIMTLTGIDFMDDEFDENRGFLKKFEELGMLKVDGNIIEIVNFSKRQELDSTNAERQARYRANKRNSNGKSNGENVTEVTLDKNRIDKKRLNTRRNFTNPADLSTSSKGNPNTSSDIGF